MKEKTTKKVFVLYFLGVLIATSFCPWTEPAKASENKMVPDKVVPFTWRPSGGPSAPYNLGDPQDQHRILIYGSSTSEPRPVLLGFHGQPKRGKLPRDYGFFKKVFHLVDKRFSRGELVPFVLVLPAFRFYGQNWPSFDVRAFKQLVETKLAEEGISVGPWFAFGHSGAAGCGGGGLNQIHMIKPKAVGFFDTCLGLGWQEAVRHLDKMNIETINIHSVETAGFRPKQRPEYQSWFDFGRAYGPLGISPTECPKKHPGHRLRPIEHRCASTRKGAVKAFVVDTGEGIEAHEALLEVALDYFLDEFFLATPASGTPESR